ncbi:MAG: inositol monophosphatase [Bacteroidetes bacterium]|nr:inositol monophosphatase [Bacteroidota bacterium]
MHNIIDNMDNVFYAAERAVAQTGQWIAAQAGTLSSAQVHTKGRADFATDTDLGAERMLVEALKPLLPDAAFLTEEKTVHQAQAPFRWIIDPIDGTTNFLHGLPCYSVSVALEERGQLLWGCVYEITRQECFTAIRGRGALLNGSPIHVSRCAQLNDALIATGFPYGRPDWLMPYMALAGQVQGSCHGIRRFGSAAVDLAYTACGRVDGYYEYKLNPWDCAAGVLLVREAGGVVQPFVPGDDPVFGAGLISGTAAVVEALEALIAEHWIQ